MRRIGRGVKLVRDVVVLLTLGTLGALAWTLDAVWRRLRRRRRS